VEVLLAHRIQGQTDVSMMDFAERVAETGADGVVRQQEVREQRQVQYFSPETFMEPMHVGWSGSLPV
jgi:hypothetical protein